MRTGRAVVLVAASASMLAAGWVAGAGMLGSSGATLSASGASLGGTSGGTSTGSPSSSAGPSTAPSAGAGAAASGTFDGTSVRTPYGSYQAEITVTAGKITDISMLKSGSKDGTSRQISGYALPLLIKAVLEKQTANVGYVSGASYTTQGFESSVQSAMQAAGLA